MNSYHFPKIIQGLKLAQIKCIIGLNFQVHVKLKGFSNFQNEMFDTTFKFYLRHVIMLKSNKLVKYFKRC